MKKENKHAAWAEAPKGAMFHTVDSYGKGEWWSVQPKSSGEVWIGSYLNHCEGLIDVYNYGFVDDWKNSLKERPDTESEALTERQLLSAIAEAKDSGKGPEEFECLYDTGWKRAEHWKDLYQYMVLGTPIRFSLPPAPVYLIDAEGDRHYFPEPMKKAPKPGTPYWLTFDSHDNYCSYVFWSSSPENLKHLEQGRCFLSREDRDANQAALISANLANPKPE